jgi:hypothetical protein
MTALSHHKSKATTLRPNALLTKIYRLLVTNKGESTSPSANHVELQPLTVVTLAAPSTENKLSMFLYLLKKTYEKDAVNCSFFAADRCTIQALDW